MPDAQRWNNCAAHSEKQWKERHEESWAVNSRHVQTHLFGARCLLHGQQTTTSGQCQFTTCFCMDYKPRTVFILLEIKRGKTKSKEYYLMMFTVKF
jgi:hypothetical protein